MIYFGDISKEHRDLLKELLELEFWFEEFGDEIAPEMSAKGFTAMAFDYYAMEMEERGDRLLAKAELLCPGYFKFKIHEHIKKDPQFSALVTKLSTSLGAPLLRRYGYRI